VRDKEIKANYTHEIIRSSVDSKTRRDSMFSAHRIAIHGGSLYDKTAKHGKVKKYSRKEIIVMNARNQLLENERVLYDIIKESFNHPISKKDVIDLFHTHYPDRLSRKSIVSFDNMCKHLVEKGLVEKLAKQHNKFIPHTGQKQVYYRATVPKPKTTEEKPQEIVEELPVNSPVEEDTIIQPNQEVEIVIHEFISNWMDAHNIKEFSINIRKGGE
jgi:hypothetical protein